MRQGT